MTTPIACAGGACAPSGLIALGVLGGLGAFWLASRALAWWRTRRMARLATRENAR